LLRTRSPLACSPTRDSARLRLAVETRDVHAGRARWAGSPGFRR
jgi:hypothetical protein